ncbi:DUF7341 domain-containing protein [Paramicrobacterium chengjingii]|uniref:DUF7341 domain-containing protein n=1 Tax=Paramicrobacterium chengjingii TaxID=2769067 RepID=UPI001423EB05|nr:hypothetical protein [Microbacterium chengjingii]
MKPETLLDAVDILTIPHIVTTRLDDGTKHFEQHDGLIAQLRQAVASSLGRTESGRSDPAARVPVNGEALIKYQQIEEAILQRFADVTERVPGLLPEDNLRAWYVEFHRYAKEPEEIAERDILKGWALWIREQFDPPRVRELVDSDGNAAACPECGFDWFDQVLNRGKGWADVQRSVALTVTYRDDERGGLTASFARCGLCGQTWHGPQGIRELAWDLENKK